ncbi:histidine phosphatase family protein [soil metagenome]
MGQLILVRHGQASFGAADYDVLSETGWAQGRALGAWLKDAGITPTALVHGSMRRHRETVSAMFDAAKWGDLVVAGDPGWDEFDHVGLMTSQPDAPEGELDRRAFQEYFEQVTARWTAGDQTGAMESYADFLSRVQTSFTRAMGVAGSGETVLVITSGGPIAAVCASLIDPEGTGAPGAEGQAVTARLWARLNTVVVNSAMSRVVVGSTGARLLTFNEHPHLAEDLLTYR